MGCEQFRVKGTGRALYHSIRCKDYTGEVVPFGEICLGRNQSEDGAKLNMRWMRGVFVGKLDRTEIFLLLTPTGAMKTRCVRRLEGDNAWNLLFLNLCVVSPWNATARSTQQLQDAQVVLESGSTQRNAEQEVNKKWWTRVMQLKLRLVQKLWKSQVQI